MMAPQECQNMKERKFCIKCVWLDRLNSSPCSHKPVIGPYCEPNKLRHLSRLFLHTWAVQKVSNLWPGKIYLQAWRSATLIPFEVVSLWLNTLLPVVPPLFKAFLECLFANGVQLGRRVPYNVISWLKSSPFQLRFQVGDSPKSQGFMSGE